MAYVAARRAGAPAGCVWFGVGRVGLGLRHGEIPCGANKRTPAGRAFTPFPLTGQMPGRARLSRRRLQVWLAARNLPAAAAMAAATETAAGARAGAGRGEGERAGAGRAAANDHGRAAVIIAAA